MEQPSYYAVIPANVRYADIPPNAKLLYGEITALTSKEGYCWASNEHFAKLYGVDKGTVSRWVSDLEEKGFIAVSLEKNYLRKITLTQKAEGGIGKNAYPPRQKPEESIKVITKENTSVAVAPQEYDLVPSFEEEKPPKKPSKYPNAKTVFSWFPNPQKSWALNTTELKHAELLFDRGEDKVKSRLRYLKENEDSDFLPSITKPSDLERKWVDLEAYAKRNR